MGEEREGKREVRRNWCGERDGTITLTYNAERRKGKRREKRSLQIKGRD